MKSFTRKFVSFLLAALTLAGCMPAVFAAEEGEKTDYSVSPDYAARYPHGVVEFCDPEVTLSEGGEAVLKLIRTGGTEGKVTVDVKAIDVSAGYGADYLITVNGKALVQDEEYTGTLVENYLRENGVDYITSDEILTDELYKRIIGYDEDEQKLTDEETAELYDASVALVADTLGITGEKAQALLGKSVTKSGNDSESQVGDNGKYASSVHELKDGILGEKTAPNGMETADLVDIDSLLGSNDKNLAASVVYQAAVGASLTVTFKDGENEKTVIIKALCDGDHESQEVLSLGLCNPTGGAELGDVFGVSVRITDDDEAGPTAIGFAEASVVAYSCDTAAAVDIIRTGCLDDYSVINVRTLGGSAEKGIDYLSVDASAVFLPGEDKKTVIVPLKTSAEDQTEEKTLHLLLEVESGGEASQSLSTVTVIPCAAVVIQAPVERSSTRDTNGTNGFFDGIFGTGAGIIGGVSGQFSYGVIDLGGGSSIGGTIPGYTPLSPAYIPDMSQATPITFPPPNEYMTQNGNSSDKLTGEYDIYSDANTVIGKRTFDAGKYAPPQKITKDLPLEAGTPSYSEEALKRKIVITAFDMQPSDKCRMIRRDVGHIINSDDMYLLNSKTFDLFVLAKVHMTPILGSDNADFIMIEQYDESRGLLYIGGSSYNGATVTSSKWREGDELVLSIEAMHGFKCDRIRVTRADGSVDYVKPGENAIITKGMKVYPEFVQSDIKVTVSRSDSGLIGALPLSQKDYTILSDHAFVIDGDGNYVFHNMVPGDIVTLYAVPVVREDTAVTLNVSYLNGLSAGDHTLTLVTDAGEASIVLTILPSDHSGDYENSAYKITNGLPAVWKKGDQAALKIVAGSDSETVVSVKIDGSAVSSSCYTATKGTQNGYTGYWVRVTEPGEQRMSNDVRYVSCVGDAYAFEVDEHDMNFHYSFIPRSSSGSGALVTGRVVTNGGTIKNPNSTVVTAGNADILGVPVQGAIVYVLSNDPDDVCTQNGITYYTSSVTDKNGCFTVYLPTFAEGLGYCIAISENNKIYQNVSIYQRNGSTIFLLPYQDLNFQIDRMTVGSDMQTREIVVTDKPVTLGVHVTIAQGYRAQYLMFRSYDPYGVMIDEWKAITSTAADWTYESNFIPKDKLAEGGKLTVEIYDSYGKGQGEYDTGYYMRKMPVNAALILPQFDPNSSVELPIIGEVTTRFDFGSESSVTPVEQPQTQSQTDISGATSTPSDKHYLEISYGAGSAIKDAVKAAKKESKYKSMTAQERASYILSNVRPSKQDKQTVKQSETKVSSGKGKTAMDFSYYLGLYMSLYTQDGYTYFEDLTLFASLSASASINRQFSICGVPVYIKFSGSLSGSLLLHVDPPDGKPLAIDPSRGGYFNGSILDVLQTTGVFNFTIKITLGAGVGNQSILSAGIAGSIQFNIDYEPWKEGAGIVSFNLDAEFSLIGISIKYNLYKQSYGVFKTAGYKGAMDFSKVKNADRFTTKNSKMLMSYRDANSLTEVYGSYGARSRGRSLREEGSTMLPLEENGEYSQIIAANLIEGVTDTVTPILMPINNGEAALLLRLDDDSSREGNDYSSVVYTIVSWYGFESDPVYLDDDSTFDSNLTAAQIGDGRILVVWSDLDRSYGDSEVELGEALNHTDLSYCIFDADGIPGEVRKLTNDEGCEGIPVIAYDEATGKTVIAYTLTDYQTEGICFDEEDLEDLGSFIYNSYSTVCFKVLDENGDIVTGYAETESDYINYEKENGAGVLEGMRYLNVQLDSKKVQSTIDELTAAAVDGTVYVAYSIDTDRSTSTDEDREIYFTFCDLTTMEQSEPVRLTENGSQDTNPQLVRYMDELLLFWNNNGAIAGTKPLELLSAGRSASDLYTVIEDDECAAASFSVAVQPDGNLALYWTGSNDTGTERRSAMFYREYDPDYVTKDEEGNETRGAWGLVQILVTAGEGQDLADTAYLATDRQAMVCSKIVNRDEYDNIDSYDFVMFVYEESSSIALGATMLTEYPMPGSDTSLIVAAVNTGSLPSEKVTIRAILVDGEGIGTEIGTEVFEEHYQSNGSVIARFDGITVPDDPEKYSIRLIAWEDDLCYSPVIVEYPFPCGADAKIAEIEFGKGDDGEYILSLDVENNGNKPLDGRLTIEFVDDGIFDPESEISEPVSVTEAISLAAPAQGEDHVTVRFAAPEEYYDENGVCRIMLTVSDGNGEALDTAMMYLHKPVYDEGPATGVTVGEGDTDEITMEQGETKELETVITPYSARNGYHVVFDVEDPSVAAVDASGNITAKKAGETKVTVSVVKNRASLFIGSDNRASAGNGTPLDIGENGLVAILEETDAQTPVITKTITLKVTGGPVEYTMTEGDGSEFVKGSGNGLEFASDAAAGSLAAVKVDGNEIGAGNYSVYGNGTKIVLKAAYLETLSAGAHTVTAVFADGEASASFTISEQAPVQTGVGSILPLITIMGLSLCCIAAIAASGGRKKSLRQ